MNEEKYIGKTFGKWTVIGLGRVVPPNGYHVMARCECGTEKLVPLCKLKGGYVTQCQRCSNSENSKRPRTKKQKPRKTKKQTLIDAWTENTRLRVALEAIKEKSHSRSEFYKIAIEALYPSQEES